MVHVFFRLAALAVACVNAHTIFQKVSVNGVDQGALVGVRSPSVNTPVEDVTSNSVICNTGFLSPISSKVINVQAGASMAAWWGHVIGGPQVANDPDNPIAATHHGPMMYYLAKVPDAAAASTTPTGLSWFKVAQDGFDPSATIWGIDRMVSNKGWTNFTLPSCLAPGNYLLRAEALALHSAYTQGAAQFYMACALLNVQGSGTWTGSNYLSFPGAYTATDPGILINIYGPTGKPDNGGKAYTPPGGAVQTCPAVVPSSTATHSGTTTGTAPASTSSATGTVALYGQCGGQGYTGPTACASGTCKASGQYYSQCVPS